MEATYKKLKDFIGFTDADVANLKTMGPMLAQHQPTITDFFYQRMGQTPELTGFIEGRVDELKKTHARWFQSLFEGDYGTPYFESRWRIGMAHVRIGLDPHWVEGVMNVVRARLLEAIAGEVGEARRAAELQASVVRILDLDLAIINLSYQEDRLDRLSTFTGMKRALIENIIRIPKKQGK